MITQERLHELFDYREDGTLIWKVNKGTVKIGDVAGSTDDKGYYVIRIDRKGRKGHRLIFLYHHGYLTEGLQIDHIDGNPGNNRIENLREVTHTQNLQNGKIHSNNTSGVKGVYWHKIANKWAAAIKVNRKQIHLGYYTILEEAAAVVKEAREKYHGEYGRHE
jgi:hypothetical protein